MKPALTAEEWEKGLDGYERDQCGCGLEGLEIPPTPTPPIFRITGEANFRREGNSVVVAVPDDLRHPVAALCLHGQEYGFTREDVELLRAVAWGIRLKVGVPDPYLTGLSDRISALLPPEEG